MWAKYKYTILFVLLSMAGCGSDGATVGGPDPITASGVLTVTGPSAATITPNGKVSPNIGAEIINAFNPYTLKFDDTNLAATILYMENQGLFSLSVSKSGVSPSGVVYGSDYSLQSTSPLQGVSVDKANHSITMTQVVLPESNGGAGSITVDGTLKALGLFR